MQKKTSTDKPAVVDKTASIEQVLAYLRMHPTFFAEHPELLKSQRLPGQDQGQDTVSLWQRQNQLLRIELEEQQQRLQQLSRAAISNEQLLNRWHSLTLDLMATADTVKFLELVDARLRKDFGADYVVLQLIDTQFEGTDLLQVAMVQRAAADYLPELQQMLASTSAYCGRLIADKREAVFGNDRPASVTLVAIEQLAVLAIGSDDADRFAPGMGGLFIELLGKTVAWQLQRHVEAFRKQA
ncbi:MAG: DUF484 family protein [Gammaproteobacteria bacterium]|jgi:uncharacterized protein YigA (DUF484 family)|nr:DUF484 family protein [Gammaproteobacteria bacterium]